MKQWITYNCLEDTVTLLKCHQLLYNCVVWVTVIERERRDELKFPGENHWQGNCAEEVEQTQTYPAAYYAAFSSMGCEKRVRLQITDLSLFLPQEKWMLHKRIFSRYTGSYLQWVNWLCICMSPWLVCDLLMFGTMFALRRFWCSSDKDIYPGGINDVFLLRPQQVRLLLLHQ